MPTSYNVMINEAQRKVLLRAVNELREREPELFADENYDTHYLPACLESLPSDEADTPRVLHGLCL